MTPTFHQPIPMGARVILPAHLLPSMPRGRVAGVASRHVIYFYIVILDEPLYTEEHGWVEAVTASGCELLKEEGGDWKLPIG